MERYNVTKEILKINLDVDNIGGLGLKQQRERTNWGKNSMKIKVSRIQPNQWKGTK